MLLDVENLIIRGDHMGISFNHRGSFKNIDRFLKNASSIEKKYLHIFKKYGQEGVKALSENTPKDTGTTANSWYYEIVKRDNSLSLIWSNSNLDSGTPIAILIQFGHGTRSGGYVEGVDYINPSLRPIFNKLSIELWREVNK